MADDTGEIGREAAESVTFENIKVGGGAPAFYQSLAMGNAVAHQQVMQAKMQNQADIGAAIAGKVAELIMATSATEGGTDVAALGMLAKMFQMSPPPTNIPTQGQ